MPYFENCICIGGCFNFLNGLNNRISRSRIGRKANIVFIGEKELALAASCRDV
jgi:hypothetical protein